MIAYFCDYCGKLCGYATASGSKYYSQLRRLYHCIEGGICVCNNADCVKAWNEGIDRILGFNIDVKIRAKKNERQIRRDFSRGIFGDFRRAE